MIFINKIRIKKLNEQLKKDNLNNIILTPEQYNVFDVNVGQYASAHSWIELNNSKTQCLIKNFAYNSGEKSYQDFLQYNGKKRI